MAEVVTQVNRYLQVEKLDIFFDCFKKGSASYRPQKVGDKTYYEMRLPRTLKPDEEEWLASSDIDESITVEGKEISVVKHRAAKAKAKAKSGK